MPRALVNSLWMAARNGGPKKRICPSCMHRLTEVPVPNESFGLDICTGCGFVWFDASEYQWLPKAEPASPKEGNKPLPPELAQKMALHRVEQIRRRANESKTCPDETWKYVPALFGIPVEFDDEVTRCTPWATLILLVTITVISLFGFAGILTPAQWGLVPADWTRMGGLTFLTSFFLHGGLRHLAGNLYYLFVFGDNVEDFLGRTNFLLLLLLSTLAGGFLYVFLHGGSPVACIGASGGISGILTYYALRFPMHRIGILLFFYRWLRFPVIAYLLFWIALQLFGLMSGKSHVAYSAHIGGMLTGLAWWLAEFVQEKRS